MLRGLAAPTALADLFAAVAFDPAAIAQDSEEEREEGQSEQMLVRGRIVHRDRVDSAPPVLQFVVRTMVLSAAPHRCWARRAHRSPHSRCPGAGGRSALVYTSRL
jgi:hypothetical protein